MTRKTTPPQDRFWSKVEKSASCWLWKGAKNKGYGWFGVAAGDIRYAHRYSYQLAKGEIPAGFMICHTCDNHACVNPEHLFLGTQTDNMQDMIKKGRHYYGYRTHCKKGHEQTPENIHMYQGIRRCKVCINVANQLTSHKRRQGYYLKTECLQ